MLSEDVVVANELEFWRQDPATKAEGIAREVERLSRRVVVCEVRVFPLEVRRQNKQWPEKQERVVKWLSASQAAEKVKEPKLSAIILRLARRYD
jgi:hypothetical protein